MRKDSKQGRRGFLKGAGVMAGSVLGTNILSSGGVAEAMQTSRASTFTSMSKGAQFRALIAKPDPLVMPVVQTILQARLAELEGFPAVFMGISGAAALHGVPNIGLATTTEALYYMAHVIAGTSLPVFAGTEMGVGSPLIVYRTVQDYERAGAAAVMVEDAISPISHIAGKGGPKATKAQMVDRIKAALDARKDPSLLILARTDALSQGYPMQEVMDLGAAVAEAGADAFFFAGLKLEDHPKAYDVVKKPLMTGSGPTTTPEQAKAAKVAMMFSHIEDTGLGAIHAALKEIKATGKYENAAKLTPSRELMDKLVNGPDHMARARKYHEIF
jgi:2-methylisocitrate lyase-like PEP mutase family enzyme